MHRSRISCRPMFGTTQQCDLGRKQTKMSTPKNSDTELAFETLKIRREGGVLFADINAPPMNLQGPELNRDFVSLIQQAEANETVKVIVFKSADPDYFISRRCDANKRES